MDDKWRHDAPVIPGIDRPLTPEECKETADSFLDLPPEFRLSAEDLEMIQEETFGPGALRFGCPEEAIAAMTRRLKFLKAQKAKALNTLDDCPESVRPEVMSALDECNRNIAATQQRLESYEYQQRNEN